MSKRAALVGFILSVALLLAAVSADAAKNRPVEKEEVTIDAPDTSVELVGYLYLPELKKYPKPPLVVLLHEAGSSHAAWEGFAQELASRGMAALAMDLRGYGLSIYNLRTHKNRSQGAFYDGDFAAYPNDIAILVGRAIRDWGFRLDTTKFAMIGAELGGSAGILWAEHEPRVKYAAIISPGLERKTLRIAPTIQAYGNRPLYLAVSDKDIYGLESCYLLSDVVDRVLDLDIFEGLLHGNTLVNANSEVQGKLINDLQRYFEL
ncbi:MAG: alpha/beta hydrolase [bacterium]